METFIWIQSFILSHQISKCLLIILKSTSNLLLPIFVDVHFKFWQTISLEIKNGEFIKGSQDMPCYHYYYVIVQVKGNSSRHRVICLWDNSRPISHLILFFSCSLFQLCIHAISPSNVVLVSVDLKDENDEKRWK